MTGMDCDGLLANRVLPVSDMMVFNDVTVPTPSSCVRITSICYATKLFAGYWKKIGWN